MHSTLHRLCFLALVLVGTGLAGSAEAKDVRRALRYPSLTPDGKSVVFCYRGDVWIAPLDGSHRADRLTIHEEQETLARVSPDGKHVAFVSNRAGGYDLYVMPVTGGEPRRITFHSTPEILCDWSPDGKKLLFMSNRDANDEGYDLYEVDVSGKGTPRRITYDGGREGTYSADGKQIVYIRGFNDIYWDNYEGSANYDIYVIDTEGGTPRRVTDTPGNERYPVFSADGKTIWFVAEENGAANFYAMPVEGGKRTQLSKLKPNDVQRPNLAWDRKTVAFEVVGELHTMDLTAPEKGPRKLNLEISSDVRNSGTITRTITSGGEQVHVSSDGSQVAFVLNGDIWIMPASGGSARRLTSGPEQDQWPRFSPNGKTIAYFSTKDNNANIFLLDLASGQSRQLTNHPNNEFFHNWSPDGKHLVFCSDRNRNKDIFLLEIESGEVRQLTRDAAGDDDPSFSPDGKTIVFDSGRNGGQGIYLMNADGSNVRRLTPGVGNYQVPSFSPDGSMIVFERYNPATGQTGGLLVMSVSGGPTMEVSRDGATACWSPRGDYIYFTAERHGESGVFRVRAPEGVVAGERVPFIGRIDVDRREEMAKVFDEAWEALRDGFYDPKMHGVDWKAMRDKYRDLAIDAENKNEFHNVLRQMLAELGASHLGVGGGQQYTAVRPTIEETGFLGLVFDEVLVEGGARKVASLTAGGPADNAGLRVGDVVTKINRATLKADTNLDKLLEGTVGKKLRVTFRPQSAAGLGHERTVEVEPIGWFPLRMLKYKEWVETCQRRVGEATKGKASVGYIHLSQMNGENLARFQQAVARWNRNGKIKGMILDVRNNGGGNIHQQLMEILVSRPLARVFPRGFPPQVQPALYWDKPVVVLINERSFSDAEVFPYMFKAAGCGKVIGVPTAGGVIGTRDITLSDGSRLRVPRTGFRGMDGTNLEGLGVKPDVLVEETSEDRLTGRDPQLMKAIEVIEAEIAEAAKLEKERKEAEAKRKAEEKKAEEKAQPKPEPKPEPKPQPRPDLMGGGALNPLADVQVGEWVRYRFMPPEANAPSTIKLSVTSVTEAEVGIKQEIETGPGPVLPLAESTPRTGALELLGGFGKVLTHTVARGVTVKETVTDLLMARVEMADGTVVNVQVTNVVPGVGLWQARANGRVVLQALEWGRDVPEEAPAKAPVEAPAAPEPAPAAAPAPAGPADPIYDAKVGEWIRLRQQGPDGASMEITLRVTEVTDDEVVMEGTMELGGRSRQRMLRRPRAKVLTAPASFSDASFARETIEIAGRTLECVVMTVRGPDGSEQKRWVCPDVPVTGTVRVERDGVLVTEIVDWGNG